MAGDDHIAQRPDHFEESAVGAVNSIASAFFGANLFKEDQIVDMPASEIVGGNDADGPRCAGAVLTFCVRFHNADRFQNYFILNYYTLL